MRRRIPLLFLVPLFLYACNQEEPETFDLGFESGEVCGRTNYGPNALVTCSPEGAFETENGRANPAEWIASLSAPLVVMPSDIDGNNDFEISTRVKVLHGCGCRRTDNLPTGVFAGSVNTSGDRTHFAANASFLKIKHTLFGTAHSCDRGELCDDSKLQLGYVETNAKNPRVYAKVYRFGLGPAISRSESCDVPPIDASSKEYSATCTFELEDVGVCHSRCDSGFGEEVLQGAALFEDIEGFASNDFGNSYWNGKLRDLGSDSHPLIANDEASVFSMVDLNGDLLDHSWWNSSWFGLVNFPRHLREPMDLDWNWDLVQGSSGYCDEVDCWWKDPDRPISTTKAAFLNICRNATVDDVDRNVVDSDNDGVCDYWVKPNPQEAEAGQDLDNCHDVPNDDQEDSDNDQVGDACDNCLDDFNPNQEDRFGHANGVACTLSTAGCASDSIGDVCGDADGDGVLDFEDSCPVDGNPLSDCDFNPLSPLEQCDFDGDGVGDACDDSDNDGVMDREDLCRNLANPGAGQIDSDGDGVGDQCEPQFTFVSPAGDPTIVAQASAQNEFVFDVNTPGVLTVPITVRIAWTEYIPTRDRLNIQIDDVGDSDCAITGITDPENWAAVGPGIWEFRAQYRCVGLPSRYDHFGLKNVTVRIDRLGVANAVAGSSPQKFEVFWPMLTNRAALALRTARNPAGWSDNFYARNHPGDWGPQVHGPGVGQCRLTRGGPFVNMAYQEVRPPNWLYYWSQENVVQGDYIADSLIVYVRPNRPCLGGDFGWSDAGVIGRPRNLLFVTDESLASQTLCRVPPSSPPGTRPIRNTRFLELHTTLFHEHKHILLDFEWTDAIHERELDFAEFFDLIDGSEWGIGGFRSPLAPNIPTVGEPFNRWRDLNANHMGDTGLACDLNDDGNIGMISEDQIDGFCDGAFVSQVDMNRDGVIGGYPVNGLARAGDWAISESRPEMLDWDFDLLPDWMEIPGGLNLRNEEQYVGQILEQDFLDVVNRSLETNINWSDLSANHHP